MIHLGAALLLMMMTLAPRSAVADCEPLPNADKLLTPGARVFVGEMHGTRELPRLFGALVCHATTKGGAVRVGLEIPADEEPRLAAYVASAGAAADRATLLAGPFWHRDFQDGRSSVAMLELIDRVRTLARAGADVAITAFDEPKAKDRDLAMAERALAAMARTPKATWLLYAGNLHARKVKHASYPTTSMAAHLVARGVPLVALDPRFGAGSAWVCFGATPADCRPNLVGRGAPLPVGVTLARSADGAIDGTLDAGAPSFSPPAAVPMTRAQEARGRSLERERAARLAYDAKDYARCGELYDALANELRAPDHAYNAACCHALGGHVDRAFAALSSAVDLGFRDGDGLAKDGDLASLRADPRWPSLFARVAPAK